LWPPRASAFATVAVVSATTVVAASPVQQDQRQHHQPASSAKTHATARPVTPAVASRTGSAATSARQAHKHRASAARAHGASVSVPTPGAVLPDGHASEPSSSAPEQSVPAQTPEPAPAAAPPAPSDQADQREPSAALPAQPVSQPVTGSGLTLAPDPQQPTLSLQPVVTLAPSVQPTIPQAGNGSGNNG